MSVYTWAMLGIVGLGIPVYHFWGGKKPLSIAYLAVVSLGLILISSLRFGIGFDYWTYLEIFEDIRTLPWNTVVSYTFEPGFNIFVKLCWLFCPSGQAVYAVFSVLAVGLVALFSYRYSPLPWLSMFAFLTLNYYYMSMNLLRQAIAGIICLYAYQFCKERKLVPFLLVVVLAASFHKTALILLPVYFLAQIALTKITLAVYGGLFFLGFVFARPLVDFVTQHIFTQYVGSIYMRPSSFALVIGPVFMCVLLLLTYKMFMAKDSRNVVMANYLIYGAVLSAFIAQFFIIERLSTYFMLPMLLFLPEVVCLFRPQAEKTDRIAELKSQLKQGGKGDQKKLREEIASLTAEIKETRTFFRSAATFAVLLCLFNQLMAQNHQYHNVFPYYSIYSAEAQLGVRFRPNGYTENAPIPTTPEVQHAQ